MAEVKGKKMEGMFVLQCSIVFIRAHAASGDEEEDDEEDEEDEDDTAELLRELEKIKRERAQEKERSEREQSAATAQAREEEIATSNPLLNLAAALGQSTGVNTTVPGTFAVKRRWDDGEIICAKPGLINNLSFCRPYIQEPGVKREQNFWGIRQRSVENGVSQVRLSMVLRSKSSAYHIYGWVQKIHG